METDEGSVATVRRRAVAILIPKEQDSSTISQFWSITLLNMKEKVFFSVIAKRMTKFLLSTTTLTQAAKKLPGFQGVESMQCLSGTRSSQPGETWQTFT